MEDDIEQRVFQEQMEYLEYEETMKKEKEKQPHKIQLQPYYYECGDHCCSEWGTDIFVDGERLNSCSQEADSILEAVLKHFGIECEVEVLEGEDNSTSDDEYLYDTELLQETLDEEEEFEVTEEEQEFLDKKEYEE